ncbi:MAG: ParB/RepB/Spo0J family partition protein [Oscillospiraceae bacterium]|nr:ParB/RepB/Spo0J family partition protein [Oscillospiraceae bacterium]
MSTMIPRSKLEPHPDNPRRELGDLEELAASIKARGVLQNLTVVPSPGDPEKYRVIIGHRRLAASAIAGLDELPCSIVEMSPADQVATMLAENMQRNDLTLSDQVDGMQLMMDLGENVKAIASKTGLSETSVRKRVTLSVLPKAGMRSAVDKGATLLDLIGITELEDEDVREKVLNSFGTNNWRYELSAAKREQDKAHFLDKIKPLISKVKKVKKESDIWNGKLKKVCEWRMDDEGQPTAPTLETGKEYCYYETGFSIQLYVRNDEFFEHQDKEKARESRRNAMSEKGRELNLKAYELRADFVRNFRCNDAMRKKLWEKMYELIVGIKGYYPSTIDGYHGWNTKSIRRLLDVPVEETRDPEESFEAEMNRRGVPRDRLMLAWILSGGILDEKADTNGYCSGFDGGHKEDDGLTKEYAFLESLGYVMSDFEKSLRDGTHPFFENPEVEI